MPAAGDTSRSDERRQRVLEAAVACFAQRGLYGTTTHEIAERAGISQPYLYRLFPDKPTLFARTVAHVGDLLSTALRRGAAPGPPSDEQADHLRTAFSELVTDRDVLRFLQQAHCAVDEPVVRDAVRACYAEQVTLVAELLDGDEAAVRRWFATGLLDNVVATLDLAEDDTRWARILRGG
ncbi:TetR/AcrR family transcriptional regulator [Pseudonocardia sp. DR1-2]|uniref:TetR/AcrR family transcriptional regulator n=1 Tax=Pseudonocardia sp. DR1-2 TaxID=2951168 RepID=UPI002043A88C|nr:TetR/AcrR family transcriptional regulator [Pseudonocardia sp. DR1-2]MCM3849676.1 TetR/AcrR family transcriptional regulator [Pseudonocardia sp. DR1-2]